MCSIITNICVNVISVKIKRDKCFIYFLKNRKYEKVTQSVYFFFKFNNKNKKQVKRYTM